MLDADDMTHIDDHDVAVRVRSTAVPPPGGRHLGRREVRVVADEVEHVPAAIETTAYSIVAETLTNVIKHARATCGRITASIVENALVLEVADDRVGGADRPADPG